MIAHFCSQCGTQVEIRFEEGRDREVCPACQTIFYRNPLPVVASVVLNDRRDVLLVKRAREPQQGMWCLPMGFAEVEESVREAAVRELEEEAGISGEVRHLLHADSYPSAHYGDLLIVSFEVSKTGGQERPGDDAQEVAYFSLRSLPPLAFRSNDWAVAACIALHRDEWQIQDSFTAFQYGSRVPLLSDPLVTVIEEHSDEIAADWYAEVLTHPTTTCYRGLDPDELVGQARTALMRLRGWMLGDAVVGGGSDEVRSFYRELGRIRATEGCSLASVLSSISLLKLHTWRFARSAGAWETPLDVYRVLELSFLVNSFFDKASYHVARGFDEVEPGEAVCER
jgi:ADP-ribose pyrophosphatase YjhB (NUDIX family)